MTFTPIAVYFLYFIFSRPDSQLCTPQDRAQDCSSAGYQPTCAIYTGDNCHSSTGVCTKTLTNACDACVDGNVIGFTLGECEEPTQPQVCRNEQRGVSCQETYDFPVCGYGQPHLRGKALTTQLFSSSCEACGSNQFAFNVPGRCQDRQSMGVCSDHKNKKCEEEQAETLCAYYIGDDCPDKMCRKTMMNSCNVCKESSNVLFFVKGECSDDIVRDSDVEEILRDDAPVDDGPIPELEAVVQEDGTVIYEEVKPEQTGDCYVEPQENIPELEAVLQEDGTFIYQEVKVPEVQNENFEPDCVVEVQENIPELEAVIKEDGTRVYEEVVPNTDPKEENIIPELEPVAQEDGSIVYEPVTSLSIDELKTEIPELEARLQEDGTFTYIDLKAVQKAVETVEPDCYVEPQENIPELEAVVQEDGSVIYEPVEPSQEPVNEEAFIVPLNEESVICTEEKVEPAISSAPVEVIESRLLTNEPAN